MSTNGFILGVLAVLSMFDWSWIVSSAPPAGLNPMAIILGMAALLIARVDKQMKDRP